MSTSPTAEKIVIVAHHLCDQAGMIFAEDLNLKALSKGMLCTYLDAGWGQFLQILEVLEAEGILPELMLKSQVRLVPIAAPIPAKDFRPTDA